MLFDLAGEAGVLRTRRPRQPPRWGLVASAYARLPCPGAGTASRGVSECLAGLGGEDAKRRLVGERLALVGRRGETAGADGIPVDSTGLPNSCRLPVTAVSSHNSHVSEEVRLICVVRGDTGPLLLFRHVAGNVISVDRKSVV